jgi:hypothetical protein
MAWSGKSYRDYSFGTFIDGNIDIEQIYWTGYSSLDGYTADPLSVTVNGIPATVSSDSFFSVPVPLNEGQNTITASVVQGSQNAVHEIVVTLVTTGSISGTVTESSTGLPVEAAAVEVIDSASNTLTASTAADGTYTINNAVQGAFSGSITKGGYAPYDISDTVIAGQTITVDAALDPVPPVISNVSVSGVTVDSALITWTTDQQSDSLVEYGITALYGYSSADAAMTTSHSITLTGLNPGTYYHFRVISTNTSGLSGYSGDNTFTTSSVITLVITSPIDNDTINRSDVMVRGMVTNSTGNETGVTVNGMVAVVYNGEFFINHVPLEEGQNIITADALDTEGNSASYSVLVNAITTIPHITLRANIESGIAPLTTYFSVSTSIPNSITTYDFDYEGDDVVDYTGAAFDDMSFTYTTEGVYYPTVTVTDDQGMTYTDTIAIIVLNQNDLDALLRTKWEAMNAALMAGDTETSLTYISSSSRESYEEMFNALIDQLPSITATEIEFNFISATGYLVKYELVTLEDGTVYSYQVIFIKNTDGIWMIQEF